MFSSKVSILLLWVCFLLMPPRAFCGSSPVRLTTYFTATEKAGNKSASLLPPTPTSQAASGKDVSSIDFMLDRSFQLASDIKNFGVLNPKERDLVEKMVADLEMNTHMRSSNRYHNLLESHPLIGKSDMSTIGLIQRGKELKPQRFIAEDGSRETLVEAARQIIESGLHQAQTTLTGSFTDAQKNLKNDSFLTEIEAYKETRQKLAADIQTHLNQPNYQGLSDTLEAYSGLLSQEMAAALTILTPHKQDHPFVRAMFNQNWQQASAYNHIKNKYSKIRTAQLNELKDRSYSYEQSFWKWLLSKDFITSPFELTYLLNGLQQNGLPKIFFKR